MRSLVERSLTPPAVMVVAACFSLFSFPASGGRDAVILASAPGPPGPLRPYIGGGEGSGTEAGGAVGAVDDPGGKPEGISLAHAAFFGPPDPVVLARVVGSAIGSVTYRHEVDPDEFVGPRRSAAVAAGDGGIGMTLAASEGDFDFVGPPRPDPVLLASAQQNEIVGPPRPAWLDVAECGFMGPPRPERLMTAARESDESVDDALVIAEAEPHEPHGLPFDPLAVGPFLPGEERVIPQPANPFAEFLVSQNDLDTVAGVHQLKHRIRPGETITELLGDLGMTQAEVDQWIRAADKAHNVDRVYAGQELALFVEMPATELKRIALEIDPQNVLIAERKDDTVVARREAIQYDRNLRVAGAEIEHSLYMTAQSQGIPDTIISDIAEVLGWEINFGRELDAGSTFRVVYEELTRVDTSETVPGRVLAVELDNRGKRLEGFYFTMPDGSHAGYYNRDGEGLGRAFMRYPVSYSRISSHFTTKRFHPVLKRNMPHYGVDFAAPTGTPVRAVADGKVERAGWYNGNGRFVKLRHDSVYESGYAHLSKIAPGIEAGAEVKKGQVIGYVGSTGLATGPHLHFAMYREGKYIDPLKAKLPRTHSLGGNALAAFRMTVDMMDKTYARATEQESEKIVTAFAQ